VAGCFVHSGAVAILRLRGRYTLLIDPWGCERGQVFPMVAIFMGVIAALVGLVIDTGIWQYEQQRAQYAADSGAIAAAIELANNGSLGTYAAANVDTAANGFPGGASSGVLNTAQNVTVTVAALPTNSQALEVTVQKALPMYFGPATMTVSASAVAVAQSNCLVALDPADTVVMSIFRGTLNMPNCGVAANGNLAMADYGISPEPVIYAKTLGYRFWTSYWFAVMNDAWPNARANAIADPCPTISGCAYLTSNPPSPQACYLGTAAATTITAPVYLLPGTYCHTTFTGSGTVALTPGLYYFQGGFTSTTAQDFTGYNITMYVDGATNFNFSTAALQAPTSGNYANVLVYQASTSPLNFNNAGSGYFTGLVYAPHGWVSICGDVSSCYRYQPAGGVAGTAVSWSSIVGWQININTLSTLNFAGINNASGNGLSQVKPNGKAPSMEECRLDPGDEERKPRGWRYAHLRWCAGRRAGDGPPGGPFVPAKHAPLDCPTRS